jgi:peptidyl-prolyl cis-trans isomerase SurA
MSTFYSTVYRCSLLAIAGATLVQWLPSAGAQERGLGAGGELLDGVAAVVNEGVVLKSELSERLALVMQNLSRQQQEAPPEQRRPLPPAAVVEQQVLDQLIVREVQLQRANKVGINVSDDMLNEALSRVAQNLGYTLEELPAVLASQGIDYTAYREDSRKDLMIEQLEQRDVVQRISITPRELEQCLVDSDASASDAFDYNVSHILIGVPTNATQQDIETARTRINEIHDRLEAGEDFARLAVATSQAQTALDGGSLGWRKGAQLPTLFADRVIRMKPGEFSEPIQSAGGFQIVRLNDMRGADRTMVDQYHVRHILLRPNEILDEDAVQQKARGIRAQIVGGDDFATVAEAVSEDTGSAAEGGDLGWANPGTFVPEFERQLAQLQPDEISEPFRTQFGWHIIQLLGRRQYDSTEDQRRQRAFVALRESKADEETELWLRRLRDEAYVEYKL